MKVQRFTGSNMQVALRMVSQQLGEDAVILSSKKVAEGFEVVAALDYQHEQPEQEREVERQLTLQQELERARALRQSAEQPSQQQPSLQRSALDQSVLEPSALERPSVTDTYESRSARISENLPNRSGQQVAAKPEQIRAPENNQAQQSSAANIHSQDVLDRMSGEIAELKNWMVSHGGNAWDTGRPMTWQQSQLWQRCQDLGLEPAWSDQIVSRIQDGTEMNQAWRQVLVNMTTDLPVVKPGSLDKGGIFALVGPTGAGKTTTIGKLAARFAAKNGAASVALITIDSYRIAARDQLKSVARILGIDLLSVAPGERLDEALNKLGKKKLILVDTAGLASQDPSFSIQLSMLKRASRQKYPAGKLRTLLVLPLTNQARCLQENYEHYQSASLAGCIFTKLDECFSLGPAMSIAAIARLPVVLIADGPHIPDDLHYPDAAKLVKLAEQMARMARTRWQAAEAMANSNRQANSQQGVR